ncbi:hypothetical protein [Nocardia salmonicida]|uniref:hypothetical protein n=1 Tax=Nocardia salmonicida TaxID=53431 RepID=UPI000AA7316B|nr:hypothetical protein [Nocardia salmonicida]
MNPSHRWFAAAVLFGVAGLSPDEESTIDAVAVLPARWEHWTIVGVKGVFHPARAA